MPILYLSKGLPGSGKTTAARKFIAASSKKIVRVNRDDLRYMHYEEYWGGKIDEDVITMSQYALIDAALSAGYDVYCDDMNLSDIALEHLHAAAARNPGTHIVWHDHTDVPLATCQERDAARDRQVGADIIRGLYERYIQK